MAFGTLPKDSGNVPISSVYIPGTGFAALSGSPNSSTDGSGNLSSPAVVSRMGNDITVLASAARTTTQTSADLTNVDGRGVKVILDVTLVGTGNITLAIKGKDPTSGKYYTMLTGSAVSSNSTTVYTIYPGLTAVANSIVSDVLPHIFQIVVTANNANSCTYSVGASLLL